jgi:hypothetical protein
VQPNRDDLAAPEQSLAQLLGRPAGQNRKVGLASLDVGLDLQAASSLLVVVSGNFASFDVCFDFHWLLLLMDTGLICGERRRVIGFDGADYRLQTDSRINFVTAPEKPPDQRTLSPIEFFPPG